MAFDLKRWYRGIPRITRWWFTGSICVYVALSIGLLQISSLTVIKGQLIWRPFTAVLCYHTEGLSFFNFQLTLAHIYHCMRLEKRLKEADYAFLLLFNWACLLLVGQFFDNLALMGPLVLSVLCVDCQLDKHLDVRFGDITLKADKYPWVMLGINVFFGEGLFELFGIGVGYLYFALAVTYPKVNNGARILVTPQFLYVHTYPITPYISILLHSQTE